MQNYNKIELSAFRTYQTKEMLKIYEIIALYGNLIETYIFHRSGTTNINDTFTSQAILLLTDHQIYTLSLDYEFITKLPLKKISHATIGKKFDTFGLCYN